MLSLKNNYIQLRITDKKVPMWHSRSRISYCHSCGTGYNCSTGSIPGPGEFPHAAGVYQKKKKKRITDNLNCYIVFNMHSKLVIIKVRKRCMDF